MTRLYFRFLFFLRSCISTRTCGFWLCDDGDWEALEETIHHVYICKAVKTVNELLLSEWFYEWASLLSPSGYKCLLRRHSKILIFCVTTAASRWSGRILQSVHFVCLKRKL